MTDTTVTLTDTNMVNSGDMVRFQTTEDRKWVKFLYFLIFKKPPMRVEWFRVVSYNDNMITMVVSYPLLEEIIEIGVLYYFCFILLILLPTLFGF